MSKNKLNNYRRVFFSITMVSILVVALLLVIVTTNPVWLGITNANSEAFDERIKAACSSGIKVEQCRANGDYYFNRDSFAYDGTESIFTKAGVHIETTGGWGVYSQGPAYEQSKSRGIGCETEESIVICDRPSLF